MRKGIAGLLFLLISIFLYGYPFAGIWIALAGCCYAVILFKRPYLWLFFIPFLTPFLNFAQKSGWFFWDLSDLFIMITMAVLYCRMPPASFFPHDKILKTASVLITLSMLVSLFLGLYPLPAFDYNAFSGYHTQYNSFRVFKGFLWALLLQQFLCSGYGEKSDSSLKLFLSGVAAGLSCVIMAALWERYLFSGIMNLNAAFRINSLFASMHVGGGAIEAYLVMTIPLLFSWVLVYKNKRVLFFSLIILTGGCYVVIVTYSRAGYLGLLVSVAVATLLSLGYGRKLKLIRTMGALLLFSATALFVIFLFMQSGYLKARFETLGEGYKMRMRHWQNAVALMDKDVIHITAGMGLGSFPRLFRERFDNGKRSGLLQYIKEENYDNCFVRLIHGADFYMDQRIKSLDDPLHYLSLDIKASSSDRLSLGVSICEKNMLHSFNRKSSIISCRGIPDVWQHINIVIENKLKKKFESVPGRPVVFSLHNSTKDIDIDVDNISLSNSEGEELICNGDFSKGYDRWFFVSDDHDVWHISNLFVNLFFERGILGLIAFLLFFFTILSRMLKLYYKHNLLWAGLISSFCGFFIIAFTVSVFDFPRITMLFFLICFIVMRNDIQEKAMSNV